MPAFSAKTPDVSVKNDVALFLAGRRAEALAHLGRTIRSYPDDVYAQRAYQQMLMDMNRWDELRAIYKARLSSHPNAPLAYYLYAQAIGEVVPHESENVVERGLKTSPENPWLRYASRLNKAQRLVDSEKPEEALALLARTHSDLFPADALMVRVQADMKQYRFQAAAADAKRAADAFPLDPDAYSAQGETLLADARYQTALDLFRKANALRASAGAWTGIASSELLLGHYLEAKKSWDAAVQASSASIEDALSDAQALLELRRMKKAREAAIAADRRVLRFSDHFTCLQIMSAASPEPTPVRESEDYLDSHPDNEAVLMEASNLRISRYDCPEAMPLIQRLLALDGRNAEIWGDLATCEARSGDYASALNAVKKGLAISPNSYGLNSEEGNFFFGEQRYPEAERSYRRAARLRPDYYFAYFGLCSIYGAQKRKSSAIPMCKMAITNSAGMPKTMRIAQALLCQAQTTCPVVRFSPVAQSCENMAQSPMSGRYVDNVSPERLFYSVVVFGSSFDTHAAAVFRTMGIDQLRLRIALRKDIVEKQAASKIAHLPWSKARLPWSRAAATILDNSGEIATDLQYPKSGPLQVTTAHILLALLENDSASRKIAAKYGLTSRNLYAALSRFYRGNPRPETFPRAAAHRQ